MRSKKALFNISTAMIYQIASIICGLITPRLILSSFGSTYNGVVSSAKQFLNLITILNIGITGATRVSLYRTLATDDHLGTSRIMRATKKYMSKVGIAILIYAVVLMVVYPFISHNDLTHLECAILIGIVSLSTFAEYFFGISNKTLLAADQSEYITSTVNIVAIIINTLTVAALIKLGCNVFVVQLGSAIVFFISPLVLNIYVKHKYKLDEKCEPDNSAIEQRRAVAFHSIANIIHNNTDIMLLTIFTDAKVISVYTVFYLIAGKMKSLLQVFTGGMEAAFGNMWAKGENKQLGKVFQTFEYAMYSFTFVAFTCMGLLMIPFLKLYTAGITDINYIRSDLAILIAITEGVFCIRQPYLLLVQAAGKYEETKKGAMWEAIINIVSSIILVQFFDIIGVIIGTLLANLIRTTQYMIFSSKYILNRPINAIFRRIGVMGLNIAVTVSIGVFIENGITFQSGWLGWMLEAILIGVASLATLIATTMIFYLKDFFDLISRLKNMLKRKAKK